MSFRTDLTRELTRLRGLSVVTPVTVTMQDGGVSLSVGFLAVDSLACSFEQIGLQAPHLAGCGFDVLKKWAEQLSRRITYLLEQIGPLEYDEPAGQVLIRSTPPSQLSNGTQYYEILLQSHQGGRFTLQRYESTKGQPGRRQAPLTTTHEVLLKLADDLSDTVPAAGKP